MLGGGTGSNSGLADPTKAPWCSAGGELAFRHLLPVDTKLYQVMARMPANYVDGHVAVLNPNTDIYRDKYFVPTK